jgi:hypothetical protein
MLLLIHSHYFFYKVASCLGHSPGAAYLYSLSGSVRSCLNLSIFLSSHIAAVSGQNIFCQFS